MTEWDSAARKGRGVRALAGLLAIGASTSALAQATGAPQPDSPPSEQAGEGESGTEEEVVVTGSRIARAGFDQPTPTTVLGDVELRQGARPNIQQILNDQPQFRPTVTPQVSNGNTSTGTAPVDLRGLGLQRTLTLIENRRFVGRNNLNFVPTSLIERVEVVTGGASAAWGSDAVAGVVNILLKDRLDGLQLGAQAGVSSRGDGARYGFDGAFGAPFAGGAGQILIGAEYVEDQGIPDRNSRRNLGSTGVVRVNPLSATDLSTQLVRDVNFGNTAPGGLITSGALAGRVFNSDGTLSPFRTGRPAGPGAFPAQVVGGADAVNLFDFVAASTPFERLSTYARASYDFGGFELYVDGTFGRVTSDAPFLPEFTVPPLTIQATNPFLRPEIRSQLAAAGQTSFTLGRFFDDVLFLNLDSRRENYEGAIGLEAELGGGFSLSAYYSHGEIDSDQRIENSRLAANFTRALDAVSVGGQIVCRVNADASTANDDPACAPLNPFGRGNASAAAIDYVTGTQRSLSTERLDAAAVEIEGDLFDLPAGPLAIAFGAEARWEEIESSRDAATRAGGFGLPVFTSDLNGGFDVREGFVEAAVPVLDIDGLLDLDLNGAARYSDYSRSGDVWVWKVGGTARLFDALLLRGTRSRDVRAPTTGELFAVQAITIGPLVDQDRAGRTGTPGYNPTPPTVTTFTGGNPDLGLELADTLTLGGSISPAFLPRFNLSVDYYDIQIEGAIIALNGSTLTLACAQGNQDACSRVTRDATGTVTQVLANQQNLATFETSGVDIEASYILNLSDLSADMPGTIRFRGLATYVDKLVFDTGVTRVDTAGEVGDAVQRSTPKWRATVGATYQDETLGLDLRVRYVDGGLFNRALTTLVNNRIASRTYVDVGAQVKVRDRFTFFGNVNNLFDEEPPLTTVGNPNFDIVGTYFTAGAKVSF